MSRDIIVFSSKQKITTIEEMDETLFVPIDFCSILEEYYDNIVIDDDCREIKGDDYSIHYLTTEEPESNIFFNLNGENALFELMRISKMYNWQIFDTGTGQMLNLKHPERNGLENFEKYIKRVPARKKKQPQHH